MLLEDHMFFRNKMTYRIQLALQIPGKKLISFRERNNIFLYFTASRKAHEI